MNAQIHRGPDGKGLLRDHRVVLGHRRLAIIDLSEAGHQPMSNEICVECGRGRGAVWVTYNGEIYNFLQLRDELINHGHLFRSKTDTEVLVHGYIQWGLEGLLSRLRGMFAFALYDFRPDLRNNSINATNAIFFLAKDRFGIKPIYYHRDRDRLVFASEVRALMKSRIVPDEKNTEALVRFLQLGSVPVPMTTVKDVLALPAGHYLSVDEHGADLKPYWDLSAYLHPSQSIATHPNHYIQTTRSLLEDSVRRHLISDVPVGLYLSGGIDSSSIAALAPRFHYRRLTTLSVVSGERDDDEARYARLVSRQCGTDHREIRLRGGDFMEEIPRIFDAMDQPTVDGVTSYFVSRAAREAGLSVMLSGAGGNEVFPGYGHFRKAGKLERMRRWLRLLPFGMRNGLIRAAIRAGIPCNASGREGLTYLASPSDDHCYLLYRGLFAPREIQELLGMSGKESGSPTQSPNLSVSQSHNLHPISTQSLNLSLSQSPDLLHSFTLFEFNHYLQNRLLKDIDVMSMAHSVETRVPFLDHRLVEYVAGVPTKAKRRNGINKPLLVKGMRDQLPKEIWKKPRMGSGLPLDRWMFQRAKELEAEILERKILDPNAVKAVWKAFGKHRVHWSRPWATMVASRYR